MLDRDQLETFATVAEQQSFERAAALRDKVRAIERTMESQKMAGFAKRRLDVLGYARSGKEAAVQSIELAEVYVVAAAHLLGGQPLRADQSHPGRVVHLDAAAAEGCVEGCEARASAGRVFTCAFVRHANERSGLPRPPRLLSVTGNPR